MQRVEKEFGCLCKVRHVGCAIVELAEQCRLDTSGATSRAIGVCRCCDTHSLRHAKRRFNQIGAFDIAAIGFAVGIFQPHENARRTRVD